MHLPRRFAILRVGSIIIHLGNDGHFISQGFKSEADYIRQAQIGLINLLKSTKYGEGALELSMSGGLGVTGPGLLPA